MPARNIDAEEEMQALDFLSERVPWQKLRSAVAGDETARGALLIEARRTIRDGARWSAVAEFFGVTTRTLERWRERERKA